MNEPHETDKSAETAPDEMTSPDEAHAAKSEMSSDVADSLPNSAVSEKPPVDADTQTVPSDAHPARDEQKVVPEAELPKLSPAQVAQQNAEVEAQMRKLSRRSFLWGAAALGASYGGWRWLNSRRLDEGVPWPFRRALNATDDITQDYFRDARLAPTFKLAQAGKETRVNGDAGLGADFDPATWKLHVKDATDIYGTPQALTLAHIKQLPRVEMVTELKCIEGWSVIVHWAGARLVDFMHKYPPATVSGKPFDPRNLDDLPAYVGMATPDNGYYVGLDMASAVHPQTLLCYEMDGKPLIDEHGAPLRLAIPVKYGVKNIKRIGTITYSNQRPADYWAEQGYDYYAGH